MSVAVEATQSELGHLLELGPVYMPDDYPAGERAPPISQPRSTTSPRFVSRVLEASLPALPKSLSYGKSVLTLRHPPKGSSADPSSFGTAHRLAALYRPRVLLVSHCDDQDYGLPPCHCGNLTSSQRRCDEHLQVGLVERP